MSMDNLIFGPFLRTSNANLTLMQNVDGQMMSREEYERRNNITREKRTRCLWIYAKTVKCFEEVDPIPMLLQWSASGQNTASLLKLGTANDSSSSGESISVETISV